MFALSLLCGHFSNFNGFSCIFENPYIFSIQKEILDCLLLVSLLSLVLISLVPLFTKTFYISFWSPSCTKKVLTDSVVINSQDLCKISPVSIRRCGKHVKKYSLKAKEKSCRIPSQINGKKMHSLKRRKSRPLYGTVDKSCKKASIQHCFKM